MERFLASADELVRLLRRENACRKRNFCFRETKKTLKSGLYLNKKIQYHSRRWLHRFPFVRNSYAVAVGLHNLIGHYGLLEKTLVTFHSHLREIAIRAIRVHNKNWRLP
ncbi:MAG: hypothetical protein IKH97_08645 [Bacteroidales bacterium]|nr:hypothetical protein [Bacteroidales bacterium]